MASIRSRIGENMEDRYLFKAKHFEEWHIGNIVKEPSGLYIRDIKENVMASIDDESTICQCTGLKDKNGNLIWENDIVGFWDTYSTENGQAEMDCIGKVVWDDETISFQVTNRLSAESYEVLDECSVIGNIFDNPELLESEG